LIPLSSGVLKIFSPLFVLPRRILKRIIEETLGSFSKWCKRIEKDKPKNR